MAKSIWHSRFNDREEHAGFEALNNSIGIDAQLFREEIAATHAHAQALHKAGIYSKTEVNDVLTALDTIESEIESGALALEEYEDIHTVVEQRLTDLAGPAGAKIQTGRSRNEQTVTIQRLYMLKALTSIIDKLHDLQSIVLDKADETLDVIVPGFTHMRPAQPIRFSYYLCALFFGLDRDRQRALDARARINSSPAGTGALAGAPFGLDRSYTAALLDFTKASENALDTVSDRDGHLELLSVLSILLVRLSRVAEDFLAWSAPAYGFLTLDDAFCTSSSLMPQKKNPDGLELVRGKSARVISQLTSLLITLKGLPMGYQKDLQEDKAPLFEAVDTGLTCLEVFTGIVKGLQVDADKAMAAIPPECLATDEADAEVKKGVPFREAYNRVAERYAQAGGGYGTSPLSSESLADKIKASVERRGSIGGTARNAVLEQIAQARKRLES